MKAGFRSLTEAIDTTAPAERMMMHAFPMCVPSNTCPWERQAKTNATTVHARNVIRNLAPSKNTLANMRDGAQDGPGPD
ncbi:MAG: hypothetical protein JO061_16710 [Acidobacteriaceae bacterium]|nr:hypothetical protein [Acidobacteriaceae bacterium]